MISMNKISGTIYQLEHVVELWTTRGVYIPDSWNCWNLLGDLFKVTTLDAHLENVFKKNVQLELTSMKEQLSNTRMEIRAAEIEIIQLNNSSNLYKNELEQKKCNY